MFSQLLKNPKSGEFHHGTPDDPVIYTMWRKGVTEPLILQGFRYSFSAQENVTTAYIKFDTYAKISSQMPNDWDVKFEANKKDDEWVLKMKANGNGGFIVTNDVFTNLAPKAGYKKQLTYKIYNLKHPSETPHVKHYYKANNGKLYASFTLTYGNHEKGKKFFIRSGNLKINPRGSRNLEYDKSKRIKSG